MTGKLYKGDIQEILVRETGMTETEASEAVRQFFGHIIGALETDRYVKVKNLGTFKLIDVEARQSVDVTTGGRIEIPEHKKVSFVADSNLKNLVNRPFSHFETVELKEGVNLSEEEEVSVLEERTAYKGEEEAGEKENTVEENTVEEEVVEEEQTVDEEPIVAEYQTDEEEELQAVEEQQAEEESDKEEEEVMEKEQGIVDIDTETEEGLAEQVKRTSLISRREELRELERQMAREEGKNRWAMVIIIILMAVFVLAGLLFLFAPEFLERLFF